MMNKIIKNPQISEKSFTQAANGKYVFIADKSVDKNEAKKQIEKMFKVDVIKINSQNVLGKMRMVGGHRGKRADLKKIILTLKKDQKIDLFEIEKTEAESLKEKKTEIIERKQFAKDDKTRSQINRIKKQNDPTALSMQGGGE